MSDIDKDIEILKKVQGIFEHLKTHGWINNIKRDVDTDKVISSIENVLSELERYKRIANMNLKDSEEFNKNMCEHRCPIKSDYEEVKQELETYKKIAEKLADRIALTNELYWFQDGFQCDIFDCVCKDVNKDCTQCIIDWARKEVEKE